jgi:hypothetical protein
MRFVADEDAKKDNGCGVWAVSYTDPETKSLRTENQRLREVEKATREMIARFDHMIDIGSLAPGSDRPVLLAIRDLRAALAGDGEKEKP